MTSVEVRVRMMLILVCLAAVDAFVQPSGLVARRYERRLADDDYEDFDFDEAFRQELRLRESASKEEARRNLLETARLSAAGVGGSVVAVAAAIAALLLGFYLIDLNRPLREVTPAPDPEPAFYFIPSNKPVV